MIILRPRLQGRDRFIEKPAALTKQPTGTVEMVEIDECETFLPLDK